MSVTLRPDQLRSVAAVFAAIRAGRRRILVQAPTGWGKGTVAAELMRRAERQGRRSLFISHLADINRDIAARARAYGVASVGVLMGDEPEGDADPAAVVATVQTLFARGGDAAGTFDLVLWDECHRAAAASYQAVRAAHPNAIHVGFTATPARADGAPLDDFFEVLIPGPTPLELVALGCLAPVVVYGPPEPTKDLAQDPVDIWPLGEPGILFASSLEHSRACAAGLTMRGIRAAHVDGTTKARETLIAKFNAGEVDALTCFRLFVEGVDVPRASVVMLATHLGHPGAMLQAIGRGRRVHPSKRRCVVYDLRGNCCPSEHGHPDEPRTFHLSGKPIRRAEALPAVSYCRACMAWGLPGRPCVSCGAVLPPPPPPRVRAVDLVELRAARDDDATKAEALRRYVEREVAAGRSAWRARWVYRGVYGQLPTDHQLRTAMHGVSQ